MPESSRPGIGGVAKLKLVDVTKYPKSGTMPLAYEVVEPRT